MTRPAPKTPARRYGVLSLPIHADKTQLVAPARRAPVAMRAVNRAGSGPRGIDALGITELATLSRSNIQNRPMWDLQLAVFNNDFGVDERGNAIATRVDAFNVLDTQNLHVDDDQRPRGFNQIAALLEDIDTGDLVTVIDWHGIRMKLDPQSNRDISDLVLDYSDLVVEVLGTPVIQVGDGNDPHAPDRFARRGYELGARGGVMFVAGRGVEWVGQPGAIATKASDHPIVHRAARNTEHVHRANQWPKLPDPKEIQ